MITDQEKPLGVEAMAWVEPSEKEKDYVALIDPVTSKANDGEVVPIPTLPPEVTTKAEVPEAFTWNNCDAEVLPMPTLPEELMASPLMAAPAVVKAI